MAGDLFTLPLRLGIRWTQLMFRAAEEVGGRAVSIAGRAVQAVTSGDSDAVPTRDPRPRPATHVAVPGDTPRSTEDISVGRAPDEPAAAQPEHVSAEPEFVRDVAEPGAEEGAGADVTVIEPWQGYERMTAQQVIERLGEASPAELATVRLYESGNRSRQTVLTAVDRELKKTTGRARPE